MEQNMPQLGFAELEKKVNVIYDKKSVGGGTVTTTTSSISVQGHYELGLAIAIVGFDFSVSLLKDDNCTVQANWPGLLEPNPLGPVDGTYLWVYVLGRAGLMITTQDYTINLTYTGPMGNPEITTGFTIAITEKENGSEKTETLDFEYQ